MPTPLERLVAAAVVAAKGDGPERTAEAMVGALGKGRPEMDVPTLRRERDVLAAALGSPDMGMDQGILAARFYGAFTASEIRAMATAGRDGEVPKVVRGADAGAVGRQCEGAA